MSIFGGKTDISRANQPNAWRPVRSRPDTAHRALNEGSLLPLDRIERGRELCPSFVDLIEVPSRFAHWERDEEAAAQAGYLRMTAQPTDGLLVYLAAVRTAYLDLGIINRAFGDDVFLSKKAT